MTGWAQLISLACFGLFFALLSRKMMTHRHMFAPRYGRRHRLCGLLFFFWLLRGFFGLLMLTVDRHTQQGSSHRVENLQEEPGWLLYDVVLGVLGVALTLFAAFDFRYAHRLVVNTASGALEQTATVTFSEMMEHSFYQGLNLVQALFLHALAHLDQRDRNRHDRHGGDVDADVVAAEFSLLLRVSLVSLVTAPWLWRSYFPVNSFSDNYSKPGTTPTSLIGVLYRLKKYQYLLYKHVLLHGLNISAALGVLVHSDPNLGLFPHDQGGAPGEVGEGGGRSSSNNRGLRSSLVHSGDFRLYWMGLNCAYVMEFFLQTLVKRGYLAQRQMLWMNQLVMFASTLAAVQLLLLRRDEMRWGACLVSLLLNLLHRRHDFFNTMLTLTVTVAGALLV